MLWHYLNVSTEDGFEVLKRNTDRVEKTFKKFHQQVNNAKTLVEVSKSCPLHETKNFNKPEQTSSPYTLIRI